MRKKSDGGMTEVYQLVFKLLFLPIYLLFGLFYLIARLFKK